MLATDMPGQAREVYSEPLDERYVTAFNKINSDTNQELIVVEKEPKESDRSAATSYLQYLARRNANAFAGHLTTSLSAFHFPVPGRSST